MIAIAVVIAIAVTVGAAFAFEISIQNKQQVEPAGTTEGREIVVNVEEKLGISEKESP